MKELSYGLGCFAGFMYVAIISLPLIFGLAWGGAHCEPVPQCQRQMEVEVAVKLAGILLVGSVVAVLARFCVMSMAARRSDQGLATTFILGASLALSSLVAAAVWVTIELLKLFA